MADDTLGVALDKLRPTQMTVGYREVETKRHEWRKASGKARIKLLRSHIVPAVIGPNPTLRTSEARERSTRRWDMAFSLSFQREQ